MCQTWIHSQNDTNFQLYGVWIQASDVDGLKQSRRNGLGKIKRFQRYLKGENKRKYNRDEGEKGVKGGDQVSSQVDSGTEEEHAWEFLD